MGPPSVSLTTSSTHARNKTCGQMLTVELIDPMIAGGGEEGGEEGGGGGGRGAMQHNSKILYDCLHPTSSKLLRWMDKDRQCISQEI